ncbi:hypothetical protein ElyMa_002821300 [Elysia marginata]|uniref:Uncharacterized protein n=1 Tax=Elysia marginata TaxID=1093978 RepID=A0AAV4HW13_9GAST|nr:hypothetical protein ElyMa_002821300 [Elysia marginata]
MEKKNVFNKWSEISALYHDDKGTPPIISYDNEGPHIPEEKVQKATKKMKKGRTERPEDIPSEMLTAQSEFEVKVETKLFNTTHATSEIPTGLKTSVNIAVSTTTRRS